MPQQPPSWFTEIDHTGDVGIEITADRLEDLYVRAARGMFTILCDVAAVAPRRVQEVAVRAADREALLVRWLSELNFLHTARHWLFCAFEIQGLSDQHLVALARGEAYNPERHTLYTEIKAVTFHELAIRQEEDGWHARIIFDL